MKLIIPLIVQIALLVAGWKLYRWAKKRKKASKTEWRRRFTALFFVSPMVLWVLSLFLENPLLQAAMFLSNALDQAVNWTVGVTQEGLKEAGAIGALAGVAKPVIHSIVYALLGALVGWPLDKLKKRKEGEGDEAAEESEA